MNTSKGTKGARSRQDKNSGIEFLRGVLAFVVMLYHYLFIGPKYDVIELDPVGTWGSYGRFAVSAFFIISGYVIAFSAQSGRWDKFAASRISRLLPAAFVCASITYIVSELSSIIYASKLAWLSSATLLPLVAGFPFIDLSYWSIAVELQFYGLVFLLLIVGFHSRILEVLTVLSFLGAVLLIFGTGGFGFLRPLPLYAALFAIGVCFHEVSRHGWHRTLSVLLALNLVLAAISLGYDEWSADVFESLSVPLVRGIVVLSVVVSIFLAALFIEVPMWLRGVSFWAGGMSYPLYLLHQNTGYALIDAMTPGLGVSFAIAFTIVFQLVTAAMIFALVERQATPWLRDNLQRLMASFPRLNPQNTRR